MLVKFNRSSVLGFHGHHIISGINDLSPEMVAEMQSDEIMNLKFDSGELEILDIEGLKNKKDGSSDISKLSDRDAKVLIEQTVDVALLEKWVGVAKSASVKKAINMKIAKIKDVKFRDEKSDDKKESEE